MAWPTSEHIPSVVPLALGSPTLPIAPLAMSRGVRARHAQGLEYSSVLGVDVATGAFRWRSWRCRSQFRTMGG